MAILVLYAVRRSLRLYVLVVKPLQSQLADIIQRLARIEAHMRDPIQVAIQLEKIGDVPSNKKEDNGKC
jgi:hypothetical protein